MDAGRSPSRPIDYRTIAASADKARKLAWKITSKMAGRRLEAAGSDPAQSGYATSPFGGEMHHLDELHFLLLELGGKIASAEYAAANTKALVVRGDAGAGKTHLFCDVAGRRREKGMPTILLHGSDFEGGDPLAAIRAQLDLNTGMFEFLSALDAAGEASGSRALVLVDALNEGSGPSVWPRYLVKLLDAVGRHPWIAIALSVRTTYESLVIPEGVVPNRASQITHTGFGNLTDKAARIFFDGNGIERPGMPMLAPEFSNPLFLTILCKGLVNNGMTRIPDGELTLMSVYNMYVDSVNRKITGTDMLDRPVEVRIVDKAIAAVAQLMIRSRSWCVDYMAAHEALHMIHPEKRESKSLLTLLIREGLLSVDYADAGAGQRRVVGFVYERLAENLVVRSVLQDSSAEDLPRLLAAGGELDKCMRAMGSYRGMIDALSIQVPEKLGRELIDVFPGGATAALYESFLASLPWRGASTVGPRAAALMDECLGRCRDPHAAFRSLLTVSTTPGHHLNADYLDSRLKALAMAERDAGWSISLDTDYHGEDSVVHRLIEWGRGAGKAAVRPVTVELAGVSLAWFLTCQNRFVRDRATKALVSLLSGHTDVLVRVLDRFAGCNDPYVVERLYCAAYGCAVHAQSSNDLERLARYAYEAVFKEAGWK